MFEKGIKVIVTYLQTTRILNKQLPIKALYAYFVGIIIMLTFVLIIMG